MYTYFESKNHLINYDIIFDFCYQNRVQISTQTWLSSFIHMYIEDFSPPSNDMSAYCLLRHTTSIPTTKGGFKSEDTGDFFCCQNKYSKSLSWAENLNKLFTFLGGKFKFSAQDSDLEYLFRQGKNSPVSSDLKPPLVLGMYNFGMYLKIYR